MASRKVLILISSIALLDMSVIAMPPLEAPPEHQCDHSSGGSDADQVSLVQLKSVAKVRRKDIHTRTSTLSSSKGVCEEFLELSGEELERCLQVLTVLGALPANPQILEIGGGDHCNRLARFASASGRNDISVVCTDIHQKISEESTPEDYGSLQYVRVDNANSGQVPGRTGWIANEPPIPTQTIREFAERNEGRFQFIVAEKVLCVCCHTDSTKKTEGVYKPGTAYDSCGAVDMSVDSLAVGSITNFLQSIETLISKDQDNAVNGHALLFPVEDGQCRLGKWLSDRNDKVDGKWAFQDIEGRDHHRLLTLQSP